jgi:hypothetical protein
LVASEDSGPFAWMAAKRDEPEVEAVQNDPDRTELTIGITVRPCSPSSLIPE